MRRRGSAETADLPPVRPATEVETRSWTEWQVFCWQDPERWRGWVARYAPDELWDPVRDPV